MMPNRRAKADRAPTAAEAEEDACFDKSPFSLAPMVQLRFKQGDPLSVHPAFLQRHPKLSLLDASEPEDLFMPQVRSLNDISRRAGHVLVHYLYSDSYQTLNWAGPTTGHDETIAKLRTGFEVYTIARRFELDRLGELAKEQISLHSKKLDAFTIIDVVSEAYPTSNGNDTWFLEFMKGVVKTAFERSESKVLSKSEPLENEDEGDIPTAKTLLRCAAEVYSEMLETPAVKGVPGKLEKLVPMSESSQPEDANTCRFKTKSERDAEPTLMSEPSQQEEVVAVASGTKKSKKDKKKGKKYYIEPGPEPEPEPDTEPKPTRICEPTSKGAEQGVATSSNKIWGLVGFNSTMSTPFNITTDLGISAPPSTVSPGFTPIAEQDSVGYQYYYQNILSMDAYKNWSGDELRLADYSRGHNQGTAGGRTGAFGVFRLDSE